jgi:hypothetical protein
MDHENKLDVQKALFDAISSQLPPNRSLVDTLMDILEVSRDSVYRRLRGDTRIDFDEASKLAMHFSISLNDIMHNKEDRIVFQRDRFIHSVEDLQQMLQNNLDTFTIIEQSSARKVYYLAKDIPFFHIYGFPELASFRMYVWLKSVYYIDKIDGKNFSMSDIPQSLVDLASKIYRKYERIPVVEIWNETTPSSLLMQIDYYYEAGLFSSKEEALNICEQFRLMVRRIYKSALNGYRVLENGTAVPNATFEMYINEILIMDNHILSEVNGNLRYFMPYGGVNYIVTADRSICTDMKSYIDRQLTKSSLISQVSEKERNRFFIRLGRQIEQLREKIEKTNPFF